MGIDAKLNSDFPGIQHQKTAPTSAELVRTNDTDPASLELLRAQVRSMNNILDTITGLHPRDFVTSHQRLVRELVEQLTGEKQRFKHVFTTKVGSTYFCLHSGESLRIQRSENGLEVKPIFRHIYFIDEHQAEELKATQNRWYSDHSILHRPIPVVDCTVGAFPFEFGIIGMSEIDVAKASGTIMIAGDRNGDFSSGSHIGHQIIEVIK